MICQTCKHWIQNDLGEVKRCSHHDLKGVGNSNQTPSGGLGVVSIGLAAIQGIVIYTGPHFGCTNYERVYIPAMEYSAKDNINE